MPVILSDITDFIIDTKHNTPGYSDQGYPCIRTPNIGRGYFILENVKLVDEDTYKKWTERAIPKTGDLILAREAPVGNVAWIPPGLKPCIGQRTVLIRPKIGIVDSRYLAYLLLGDECQNRMISMSLGSTVAHLNMSDIRTLELPDLPPLPTQRKIASILTAYDDLIENNLRRIKILEEMAQNLYREWFVNFRFPGYEKVRFVDSPLGRIPEGWEVVSISDLIRECKERNAKNIHYPTLTVTNQRRFVLSDNYFTKRVYSKKQNNYRIIKSEQFAYNPARINIGSIAFMEKDRVGIVSPMYCVFEVKSHRVFPDFLWNILNQYQIMDQIKKLCFGTVRQIFKFQDFNLVVTVLPSIDLQKQYKKLTQPIKEMVEILRRQSDCLMSTRELILPQLISGELDVSELKI